MCKLHHCSINVSQFDRYVSFFQEVFQMQLLKKDETPFHRKIWFKEGIQLNEASSALTGSLCDHIGISTANKEAVISTAINKGCTLLPDKQDWIVLPNGVIIELIQNTSIL